MSPSQVRARNLIGHKRKRKRHDWSRAGTAVAFRGDRRDNRKSFAREKSTKIIRDVTHAADTSVLGQS